jgi:hypothetical protein
MSAVEGRTEVRIAGPISVFEGKATWSARAFGVNLARIVGDAAAALRETVCQLSTNVIS